MLSGKRHGNWDDVLKEVAQLEKVAESVGCSAAQLALAWCIANNRVSTVIFGATTVEQVLEVR
jgi:aryl-alcohol dehydrogenase-like predicted oxidoreductase